jgi:hypothetical protein
VTYNYLLDEISLLPRRSPQSPLLYAILNKSPLLVKYLLAHTQYGRKSIKGKREGRGRGKGEKEKGGKGREGRGRRGGMGKGK